jgi:exonuclease SbcC
MPSRAGAEGLGAFSYYDHVYLPESQKELVWEHRGRRYKSQLVFRINGKPGGSAFAPAHWHSASPHGCASSVKRARG